MFRRIHDNQSLTILWPCLQGVFYTHRSNYLTGLAVAMPDGLSVTASSRILLIVPMFHANAWAIPYAAFAGGASLVLPGEILLMHSVFVTLFIPTFCCRLCPDTGDAIAGNHAIRSH